MSTSSHLERLALDNRIRVIILAGSGKHFNAGGDLQWIQRAAAADGNWNLVDARRFAAMLARIDSCPNPTWQT